MITGLPRISDRRGPTMRASTSSAPPGANGITMVIGFAGQSCAAAGKAASTSAVAIIAPTRRMGSSLKARSLAPPAGEIKPLRAGDPASKLRHQGLHALLIEVLDQLIDQAGERHRHLGRLRQIERHVHVLLGPFARALAPARERPV